jgi:molybdopterin-guanine dinucleotide biosynthesis protein A
MFAPTIPLGFFSVLQARVPIPGRRLKCAARGPMMGTVTRKIRCAGRPMTAIVLAGGRGRRMMADKAGLDVGGRTLLEHVLAQLAPRFDEILISVSPGRSEGLAGKKLRPETGMVEDEAPDLGPLGGILAGLKAAANDACAVIACDIPDIDLSLLRALARAAADADIAVPVDPMGRREPLFAIYRRPVVPAIDALLRSGERSVLPLFERCRTAAVDIGDGRRLRNLNTRGDYESYLIVLAGRRPKRP